MDIPVSVILIIVLEASIAFFLIEKEYSFNNAKEMVICAFFVSLAFYARYKMIAYTSQDYIIFLSQWIESLRNSGIEAIGSGVSNYNIPYMFILYIISKVNGISSLYLIKVVSIFFDIVLAWSSMKIVEKITKSKKKMLITYLIVLFLPTVMIDSALWGQCDSIYVSLAVLSIYLVLDDKPWLSVAAVAVSFAFKLQAIFVMPVFAYFLFTKRVKWYHLMVFPIVYLIMMIPGLIGGMSVKEALLLYTTQTESIGTGYSYNAPSFLSIIESGKTLFAALNTESAILLISKLFILIAFIYTIAVLVISIVYRKELNSELMITILCALFSLGIPYFLPHMHERYFYMADAFLLILSVSKIKYLIVFALTQLSSLGCYIIYYYSVKTNGYGPVYLCAAAMGTALIILFIFFALELKKRITPKASE